MKRIYLALLLAIFIPVSAWAGPSVGNITQIWDQTHKMAVTAAGRAEVDMSGTTIPLPTGAATEATLSTLNGKVTACNTGATVISSSVLPTGAATEATLSTLNGKVTACNTGAVTISGALPAGSAVIGHVITDSNSVTAASGDVASGSSDSGNPVKIGLQARTTNPTAVSDAQRVNGIATKEGVQLMTLNKPRSLRTDSGVVTLSSTTAETTILAAGASGVFHDVEAYWCANTSGTATRIDFRDDTGGTIRFTVYVPAGDTRGAVLGGTPTNQTTAAKPWTIQSSASVADVRCFLQAVKDQ